MSTEGLNREKFHSPDEYGEDFMATMEKFKNDIDAKQAEIDQKAAEMMGPGVSMIGIGQELKKLKAEKALLEKVRDTIKSEDRTKPQEKRRTS